MSKVKEKEKIKNEDIKKETTCECNEENCQCEEKCHCDHEKESDPATKTDNLEKEHKDKLNEAYNKISELEDKLIRQNADMINYRKRKEEETTKLLKYCNEDIIKDILPILDNFERAITMENDISESESKLLDGIKMVYSHLENVMEKYEVKMIDGSNKPFDPVYHNAVLSEQVEGLDPGMVVEVLQKGYLLKDKVIRTAMVKVSI